MMPYKHQKSWRDLLNSEALGREQDASQAGPEVTWERRGDQEVGDQKLL